MVFAVVEFNHNVAVNLKLSQILASASPEMVNVVDVKGMEPMD